MPKPPNSPTRHSGVAFMLAQIGAHAADQFASRLEPLKFRPAHAGILRVLDRQGGLAQRALAAHLGMFPSRLVLVLDELEKAGLLERRASDKDRRTYALHLTEQGRKSLQAIGQAAREHEEAICAALEPNEREVLTELLSRIAAQQSLTPGVHPGYRQMGREGRNTL
jgi:DNA-binding MarR family transcriptional regulator